jgi:hypothetical protein
MNLQATIYEYLYRETLGKGKRLPVAFIWYQLGTMHLWATSRKEEDFRHLEEILRELVTHLDRSTGIENFPPSPDDYNCSHCAYPKLCLGEGVKVTDPIVGGITYIEVPRTTSKLVKQLKLGI